jgi:hypothetical protein
MKTKSCLIAFSFLYFSTMAFSQEKGDHEIRLNVAYYSSNRIIDETFSTLTTVFSLGQTYTRSYYFPPVGVGFQYAVRDRWTIGIDGYYEAIRTDYFDDGEKHATEINRYITIGVCTDFNYISQQRFRMYSGIAVAFTYRTSDFINRDGVYSKDQNGYINGHLNVLGMRFGNRIAGYLELGFGYRGLVNGGISVRLEKHSSNLVPLQE